MADMEMWVFKHYRDKHPEAVRVGWSHIRNFGKVEGTYDECYKQARKILGRANRGRVYLAWKWTGTWNDGCVAQHDNGLAKENRYSWDHGLDFAPVMHMMRRITAEE